MLKPNGTILGHRAFGRPLVHEDGAHMSGIHVLTGRDLRDLASCLCSWPCENTTRSLPCAEQGEVPPGTLDVPEIGEIEVRC